MIIRLVKMEFRESAVADFLELFETRKAHIKACEGCLHVALWRDVQHPATFFTYSHWRDEAALEAYRQSPFFKDTWTRTRALFAQKAAAWSVQEQSSAI